MRTSPPIRAVLLLLLLSLGLIAGGCAKPTPTLSPPTPAVGSEVLFHDDFSRPTAAWLLFEGESGSAQVRDGELYLEATGRETALYTPLQGGPWEDVIVSVQLRQVDGTQDNWMGLLCRQADAENYYLFAISADGYYLMLKVRNGVQEALAGPTYTTLIHTGRARNRLTVRCEGGSLQMSVNERFLVNRSDDDLPRGGVALFADGMRGGTTVAFDDFLLTRP